MFFIKKPHAMAAAAALGATIMFVGCGGSDPLPATTTTPPTAAASLMADTVLRNGQVVTIDAQDSTQQAVAVRDGKIIYVGNNSGVSQWIGTSTQVIDLEGRMLMPGFIDAHLHSLAGGRALLLCDFAYAPLSHAQIVSKLQSCLDATADQEPNAWLEAVNWDRSATSAIDGDPTRLLLDTLKTKRPIAITSSDFHGVLANSRALSLANITAATPDPSGGKFLRDVKGNPTGVGEDAAGFQIKASIPPDTEADLLKQGRAALAAFRVQGITSFMDAAANPDHSKTFRALQQSGELTARVNLALMLSAEDAAKSTTLTISLARTLASSIDQGAVVAAPGINARIVKIFMDGVVNAPADTGAMLTPYFTNKGTAATPDWQAGSNTGTVYYPANVLKPLMLSAAEVGLDVHVHATGDRAVRETLDAVENLRVQRPMADFRPAISHAETVAVADYPRFAALDVLPTMSFQWAQRASYSIGETENHLGPERFSRMEPSGSLRMAGARVVSGSDWPIDAFDTFLALKVGVTRSGDPTNPNSPASQAPVFEGKINKEPGLSRADVLRAITMNAAQQLRLEKQVGSIEVGKFADLIVLDRNFMTASDDELGRNKVLLTMVGGKVVMAINAMSSAQSMVGARASSRILSPHASTGHATLSGAMAGPHGDGHRH
ncbi:MAG: amidohydrolase [Pseudomonadota bacterium]